jgi:hypothetical protein
MLEKLVGHFRSGNNGANRETVLGIEENIADQERFAGILLSNHHYHRRFSGIYFAPVF